MCWNKNNQGRVAAAMIFISLLLLTFFDGTKYAGLSMNLSSVLLVLGIVLMLHNMFFRKSCKIK